MKNNCVVFGTPRCGSTYVQELLIKYWQTTHGVSFEPETEIFNQYKKMSDDADYTNRIVKLHTWGTSNDVISNVIENATKVVAVQRDDYYEQFVSWLIARHTGQWFLKENETPIFPDEQNLIDISDGEITRFATAIARYQKFVKTYNLPIIKYETALYDLKQLYPDIILENRPVGLIKQNTNDRYKYVNPSLKKRFQHILTKANLRYSNRDWSNTVDDGVMCAAPWVHMYIDPAGQVSPCCTALPVTYGNTNDNTLEEIWNSKSTQLFREKLLDGKPQDACRFCYQQEKHSNVLSLREWLTEAYQDKITNTTPDFNLHYVDIRASNICNFACTMCNEHLSSNWHSDKEKLLNKKLATPKFQQLTQKTKDELTEKLDDVHQLYWAGGEPLITEFHYDILDELIQREKFDIQLRYNTNLSKLSYKRKNILDYWKKFDKIDLSASVDLHGERGEYQRYGLVWQEFLDNWKLIKQETPHVQMNLQLTVTSHTVGYLPEFCDIIRDELKVDSFAFNFTHKPIEYNPQVIPPQVKEIYTKKLLTYTERDDVLTEHKDFIYAVVNFLHDKHYPKEEWIKAVNFYDRLDKIRGNSWRKLWPELEGYD